MSIEGPMLPNKLLGLKSLKLVSCVPPSAINDNRGKKLARDAPINSLAAAVCRSLSATSGRLRNTSAGTVRGGLGAESRLEERATENEAADLPTSAAMEFSSVARSSVTSDNCASA